MYLTNFEFQITNRIFFFVCVCKKKAGRKTDCFMFQNKAQTTACPIYCTVHLTTNTVYNIVWQQKYCLLHVCSNHALIKWSLFLTILSIKYFTWLKTNKHFQKQVCFSLVVWILFLQWMRQNVAFMINWSWSSVLSAGGCRWSSSACRDSAWVTGSLQLAESRVQPWTAPSTGEGRPGWWADRCRAGQRLLCSHQHESRQSHRTPLSHPSAAVHCHPFPSTKVFPDPVSFYFCFLQPRVKYTVGNKNIYTDQPRLNRERSTEGY